MTDEANNIILDGMMSKAKKIDLSKYGYKIALYDNEAKAGDGELSVYVESVNKDNKFNAMYSGHEGRWLYYYDEREGFLGGWMDINPTDLINLVKITNYLTSGV